MYRTLLCVLLMIGASTLLAEASTDLEELETMYAADQGARKTGDIDWSVVSKQDAEHRARALALLRDGSIRTANDHFRAAMIFQHGLTLADIRLAHALATIAMTLDPSMKQAKWLAAASWDRALMYQKQAQWYGTQFHQAEVDGPMVLYPVAEGAVTDADRKALNVPTLAEAHEMAKSIGK